ncbi:fluoride efflux transporter CrcB [Methanofollis aquaemaris]|uniref:Fluoride-specific ion channel FluC n=1 Tax=Methanofollis aquaemaris TaxID=126734 RepID=A0A8A3S3J8_9EURY|nr:fluoride efflux transporter CrcB [Methanofollis aquaemaris]QSZ66230.1 fluoride efflux transporter CrcB [Methanofollis aquaemaris]
MQTWIIVGIGGFIGAVLRYFTSGWLQGSVGTFPVGTLGVNVIGSFFIGVVMYLSEYGGVFDMETRIFLTLGILGAFTTMSTFSYESFRLLEQQAFGLFALNLLATITLTLLAVWAGKIGAGYLVEAAL